MWIYYISNVCLLGKVNLSLSLQWNLSVILIQKWLCWKLLISFSFISRWRGCWKPILWYNKHTLWYIITYINAEILLSIIFVGMFSYPGNKFFIFLHFYFFLISVEEWKHPSGIKANEQLNQERSSQDKK